MAEDHVDERFVEVDKEILVLMVVVEVEDRVAAVRVADLAVVAEAGRSVKYRRRAWSAWKRRSSVLEGRSLGVSGSRRKTFHAASDR